MIAPTDGPPLYPLRMKEVFQKRPWGGDGLKKALGKKCPAKTGESWELSVRPGAESVVANGPLKGKKLGDLLKKWPRPLLGDEHHMRFSERFPLLVKFLTVHDRMSLQVHPSDEFAQRYEIEGVGKMEAWYVLSAPKGCRVIRGVLPGTTVAEFRAQLDKGSVEQCLNVMDVHPSDVIFIPPGTIHSAYGGVVVLEVQQNSDLTYRLTDWGRKVNGKARELHVEKALNVTDFYSMGVSKYKPSRILGFSYKRQLLIKCEKFTMEAIQATRGRIKEHSNPIRFSVYTVVSGKGRFVHSGGEKSESFRRGETYFMPAHLGAFEIVTPGAAEIVVSYVE
ncbi:MAG: class I mannose-6-phosphate isomerase [Planctomycetes bacterium]|nr:class I mannose-6-phosphate isomerase [Planctomycetota bacterium]